MQAPQSNYKQLPGTMRKPDALSMPNGVFGDPPVEIPTNHVSALPQLIESAKSNNINRNRDNLINDLYLIRITLTKCRSIPEAIILSSDICQLLLNLCAQNDDIELQYSALECLIDIFSTSRKAVEVSLSHDSFPLFSALYESQNPRLMAYGFRIISIIIQYPEGRKVCINKGAFSFCLRKLRELSETTESIEFLTMAEGSCIHSCWTILSSIVSEEIPILLEILSTFSAILYHPTHIRCAGASYGYLIVTESYGDQGVSYILSTGATKPLVKALASSDREISCDATTALISISSIHSLEDASTFLKEANLEIIMPMLTKRNDYDSDVMPLMLQLVSNIYILELKFGSPNSSNVIIRPESIVFLQDCLENGNLKSKLFAASLMFQVIGFSKLPDLRLVMGTKLPILSLDVIDCANSELIQHCLKAIGKMLGNLVRNGFAQSDLFNEFKEKLVAQLLGQAHSSDNTISLLALSIIRDFFPDSL